MLIEDAEIDGRAGLALRIKAGRVEAIAAGLRARPGETVIDARGGALLPGLRDHHLHLFAAARALDSVECGPPSVHHEATLREALAGAAAAADSTTSVGETLRGVGYRESVGETLRGVGYHESIGETLRGVGYHESVAGELDATRLEGWVGDRPLRIQHRSGALWILNHTALARIPSPVHDWPAGAERDRSGRPTGRFYRLDGWLRDQLGSSGRPSLARVSRELARHGVTRVTDATPSLDDEDAAFFIRATESGDLLQRAVLMGSEALGPIDHPRLERGALKIVLDEPRLPDLDALIDRVRRAHAGNRAVAVHCATRVELAVAVTALEEAGTLVGDRIEHASVAPPEWVDALAKTSIAVVTQPHFIRERGDVYVRDVEEADQPWLYRARAWLDAGVPLAAGSDAPYGHLDPWRSMRAAVDRETEAGLVMAESERLDPEESLALFTREPAQWSGSEREISCRARADLVLLDAPWSAVRSDLDTRHVRLTLRDGEVIHARDESDPS